MKNCSTSNWQELQSGEEKSTKINLFSAKALACAASKDPSNQIGDCAPAAAAKARAKTLAVILLIPVPFLEAMIFAFT